MPRLSMWKPNKTNDYSFHDNRIREMFTVGGTGINIHKYLGTFGGDGSDATNLNMILLQKIEYKTYCS